MDLGEGKTGKNRGRRNHMSECIVYDKIQR